MGNLYWKSYGFAGSFSIKMQKNRWKFRLPYDCVCGSMKLREASDRLQFRCVLHRNEEKL